MVKSFVCNLICTPSHTETRTFVYSHRLTVADASDEEWSHMPLTKFYFSAVITFSLRNAL